MKLIIYFLPVVMLALTGCHVFQTEASYQTQQKVAKAEDGCVVMNYIEKSAVSPERAELLRVPHSNCLTRGKTT